MKRIYKASEQVEEKGRGWLESEMKKKGKCEMKKRGKKRKEEKGRCVLRIYKAEWAVLGTLLLSVECRED